MKKKLANEIGGAYARLHSQHVTKDELNSLIGEYVTITLISGSVVNGILGFTKEFSAEYGYRQPGYYTIGNLDFLVSHIKKIERSALV